MYAKKRTLPGHYLLVAQCVDIAIVFQTLQHDAQLLLARPLFFRTLRSFLSDTLLISIISCPAKRQGNILLPFAPHGKNSWLVGIQTSLQ